jgi:phospholipase C
MTSQAARTLLIFAASLASALVLCCSGAPAASSQVAPPSVASVSVPAFSHVVIVVMENEEVQQVLGSGAAPYLDSLAARYAVADQFYGIAHPSLPNYLALIGGSTFGISSDCTDCFVNSTSLVDQIESTGRTWRAYEEGMPAPCLVGDAYPYAQRHNPFIYFTPIRTDKVRCTSHIVPFDQFAGDLTQGWLPDFAFITPDVCHDMHDCSIADGDRWLSNVVPTILNSSEFQSGGVLFITWDEGETNAGCCNGLARGGHIPTLVISSLARSGFHSDMPENHYNLLRTIEDAWGLPSLGHAANVGAMDEYFVAPA